MGAEDGNFDNWASYTPSTRRAKAYTNKLPTGWNALDNLENLPSPDTYKNLFQGAGYGGKAGVYAGDPNYLYEQYGGSINPEVYDWLDQNQYTVGQSRNGGQYDNAVFDANGNIVSSAGYTDKGIGPIKYIVPALLGGIAGGAALTGLGVLGGGGAAAAGGAAPAAGNGAFLGEAAWAPTAAGAGSAAPSLGMGAEMAAGASGIGAAGANGVGAAIPAATAGSGVLGSLASGAGSLANFAKANPGIAASAAGGLATLLNGNGGSPPSAPNGGTSGGQSQAQLIQALTDKLYGPNGSMSNSFDYSSVPGLKTSAGDPNQFNQEASDAAYRNATRYLEPQVKQQQQALEARLSEQGFVPGTPGYQQAMQNFMDANARAYAQARDTATLQGFTQGNTAFSQGLSNANLNNSASREQLAQLLAERNQPLNELNALKTGEQLSYENQLGQYNADVTSKNSTNQALAQLALALGMYLG